MTDAEKKDELVESYLRIRTAIGLLAVLLPIVLFASVGLKSVIFAPSISEFYYTPMSEVLVATIGGIAVFLISYKGYPINEDRAAGDWKERWLTDRRVSYWAAFGALGVAFFPTFTDLDVFLEPEPIAYTFISCTTAGYFHQASALLFFGALSIFCLSNFRRGETGVPETGESKFYKWCGRVLLFCMVGLIIVGYILKQGNPPELADLITKSKAIFWIETVGLFAFAAAWLRKGQALSTVPSAVREFFGVKK